MGGPFLLAAYLLLLETLALACLPREYIHNGICCPMCDKGSFVKSHCESESSSSTCVICSPTTFIGQPSGLTECFRCKDCDPGVGQIVKQPCTSSSDTVCDCQAGHFCLGSDCELCQEHKRCQPGEYVKKAGTSQTDTACEKCPPDHFSNKTNSVDCFPWQKCSKLNLVLYKSGTSTTDSICTETRSRGGMYAAFCFSVILIVLYIVQHFLLLKQGRNEPKVEEEAYNVPFSEEEEGIQRAFRNENNHGEET